VHQSAFNSNKHRDLTGSAELGTQVALGSDLEFPSGSDLESSVLGAGVEIRDLTPGGSMRISVSLACSAAVVVIFAGGAAAQGKGSPQPKVTSPATAPKSAPTKTTTSAPKAKPTKTADTASAHGKPTTTTASTKSSPKENHKSTTTTPTTSPTAPTGAALTPVQQKLQQNTNLASKLQSRLPPGTDLNTAAAGFRNLGQFVAAVNVSNNLGLDFPTLKTAMVTDGKSLGQAIQAQKSTVDGTSVATRAEHDADTEIRSTEKAPKTPKTKSAGGRP